MSATGPSCRSGARRGAGVPLKRTDREGPLDPAEQDAARALAEELGYLPLALEQAAAYMVEHEEAFSVYLAAYRVLRLKLLDEMGPVTGEYPETVRTTWKRSFDAVAAASPASIELLRFSAFFAPYAIPLRADPGGGLRARRAARLGPRLPARRRALRSTSSSSRWPGTPWCAATPRPGPTPSIASSRPCSSMS